MQKAKPFSLSLEPLRTLPSVLIALCLTTAAVDALLAYQPNLLRPIRDGWQSWLGQGWVPPSSASLVASSVAIACSVVSAVALSSLIRAVQALAYGRVWMGLAFIVGGAVLGYAAGYLPVKERLDATQARMQRAELRHGAALDGLRTRLDAERKALEQQLAQERARMQPPPADAAPSADATAAAETDGHEPVAEGASDPSHDGRRRGVHRVR